MCTVDIIWSNQVNLQVYLFHQTYIWLLPCLFDCFFWYKMCQVHGTYILSTVTSIIPRISVNCIHSTHIPPQSVPFLVWENDPFSDWHHWSRTPTAVWRFQVTFCYAFVSSFCLHHLKMIHFQWHWPFSTLGTMKNNLITNILSDKDWYQQFLNWNFWSTGRPRKPFQTNLSTLLLGLLEYQTMAYTSIDTQKYLLQVAWHLLLLVQCTYLFARHEV